MLKSLEPITNCKDYYIDTDTIEIISFKKYKEGRPIKVFPVNKKGHLQLQLILPEGRKYLTFVHVVVRALIDKNFDFKKQQIIFKDGDITNCHPSNLEIVEGYKRTRNNKYTKNVGFVKRNTEPVKKEKKKKPEPIYEYDILQCFSNWSFK